MARPNPRNKCSNCGLSSLPLTSGMCQQCYLMSRQEEPKKHTGYHLTKKQVIALREEYDTGGIRNKRKWMAEKAKKLGKHPNTISKCVRRKSWKVVL